MSNVSPTSNSNFSDVAVETGQKIVKNDPDICFFAPWRDLSFKYIYTRDNAKYGIAFARDVAQVIGFKPLQARDGQSLRDENDRFKFVRTLNIPLGVPTQRGGRTGVLESDVFFVVRDKDKTGVDTVRCDKKRDPENEVCIHFEMQSAGNLEVTCKRSLKYESEQLALNAVPDVVESPENLIGIVVFQNTNQDCSAFNVFNDSNTDVKCQGKAHPRMGVVLHMNKNKEADDNTKLDEVIKNRWKKGGISMGGKKIQINEKNANFESWNRLKQRIIALSLLDKFKTEDEFKQYVSNEEVRNEFMCMINDGKNIKLHKNDEYMREHLAGYSSVYNKGRVAGRVEVVKYTSINELPNALRDLLLDYPDQGSLIKTELNNRKAEIDDEKKKSVIDSFIKNEIDSKENESPAANRVNSKRRKTNNRNKDKGKKKP